MDEPTALVAAAVISAAVVAATFGGTELLRWRREVRAARVAALGKLIFALEKLPKHAAASMSRLPWRRFSSPPDLEIASAGVYLYAVLPRRDWRIVKWIGWRLEHMATANLEGRVVIAADIASIATVYISQPARARRYVERFRAEIEHWFSEGDEETDES